MPVSVKICGLNDPRAVQSIIDVKADYAGFVYFPASPRHITLTHAATLKAMLPERIRSVSVVVDPDDALLGDIYSKLKPDYIQLHGKETPERLKAIRNRFSGIKLIKALSIKNSADLKQANLYDTCADMLMFDAKPPEAANTLPGGNGLTFDWNLLSGHHFNLPWMLSGGLTPANVAEAIAQTGAAIVDVSSGVEQKAGVKDPALIAAFVKAVKLAKPL